MTDTNTLAALVRACASFVRDTYFGEWADDAAATLETDADLIERGEPCSLLRLADTMRSAAPAVVEPPADRAALRDRIAAAIWERQNPGRRWADCEYRWRADAEEDADAVLAVLPEPAGRAAEPVCICGHPQERHFEDVCQTCGCGDYLEPRDAAEVIARWRQAALKVRVGERAAVLREAATIAESLRQFNHAIGARKAAQVSENVGILRVADELRRRADETPAAPCAECGHPSATHREGDDPVSPGRCSLCPDDDAWHDHQPAPAQVPTPLRWGLDDVLHGDDDTTMLMLSGPAGEPYWLELEPERAAALRDSLTGPGEPAAQAGEELTSGVQQCGFDDYHDPHEWHDKPHIWCPGHSAADDAQPAQPQPDTTP